MKESARRALHLAVASYAGMLFGVSFIATPAKFLATEVSRADLLLVGRATFGTFAWVEATGCILLAVLAWRASRARAMTAAVVMIVASQYLLLRPVLDARVSAIVAGQPATPSALHHVYGVLELAKLGVLSMAGWKTRSVTPPAA